jgi:hypothetical protein
MRTVKESYKENSQSIKAVAELIRYQRLINRQLIILNAEFDKAKEREVKIKLMYAIADFEDIRNHLRNVLANKNNPTAGDFTKGRN